MARPAASSLALLIRRPDDRRCREVANEPWDTFRLRCAFNEAILVLILAVMLILQTCISGWATCHSSPWSASLRRSNQTAVESGNGGSLKKLMEENTIYFRIPL